MKPRFEPARLLRFAATAALLWGAAPGAALAANFCVSTAPQLSQALIDARFNNQDDVIQLVQGTYFGNFLHIANFDDLRVEGGYVPGCGSRVLNPANTVIDGNTSGRALFLYSNNIVAFSVDGVTVRNGRATGADIFGAGLLIVTGNQAPNAGGTISVSNCVIRDNVAVQDGAGMYLQKADVVTVTNNVIQNNAGGFGGGLYLTDNASVTLTGNLFSGNSVSFPGSGDGGGMYVDMTFPNRGGSGSSTLTITGNSFTGNAATTSGGGYFLCGVANGGAPACSANTGWTSSVNISFNTFSSNTAQTGGGGDVVNGNSITLDANTFGGNSASAGGAAAFFAVDAVTLTNNLIQGNSSTGAGGGLLSSATDTLILTNNTVTGNSALTGGGFGGGAWIQVRDDADVLRVYNNIVFNNTAQGGAAGDLYIDNNGNGSGGFSSVQLEDNDFDQGAGGFFITQPGFVVPASNLNDVNPLFVNPGAGDYHLQAGSPCRDTGNNGAPGLPAHDHDFLARVVGGTVDMGAFEYQSADLSVTKTDGQGTEIPGTPVTYAIVVANAGPSPVTAATVSDTPPPALTGVTWTCSATAGSSCPASGSGAINHVASLAVGGTLSYSLTGFIDASATGTLANTASVSAPAGVPDPSPGNNSATDTDTLTPQADLQATKTDSQASAVPGLTLTYQMTVANAGPSSVTGATVSDTVPGALTGVTWACSASAGSSCPASGSGSINHAVNLAPGGLLSYTLTGTVSSSATGSLSNTLAVAAPGGVTDPAGGNNSATDTDTLTPLADLRISKTDGQSSATPGGVVTYTIRAASLGPSQASGATVADAFPGSITGITWTCTPSGGASCGGGGGAGNINRVVDLPPGGVVTFVASGSINGGATGTLVNTTTVTAPGGVTDPDASNNAATDVDNLTLTGLSELVHGSERVRSLASTGPGTPANLFWLRQAPRSSYEIVVDGVTGDVASGAGTGPGLERLAADASTVLQNSTSAGAGASRSLRFENASSAAQTDEFVRVRSAGCTAACGPEDVYRIRAWETTYRAARFNNSATQVTVLLIQNRTSSTVNGTVWLRGATGALVGSQAFSLAPKGLLSLNTATLAPGTSGSLTVSSDGVYGGLTGKAVAVEPATGFTFDSPLLPRER